MISSPFPMISRHTDEPSWSNAKNRLEITGDVWGEGEARHGGRRPGRLVPMSDTGEAVVLRGDGLVLREWRASDVVHLPGLFNDPDVDRWTPLESPFGPDAAQRYLDRAREGRLTGRTLQFAVTLDGGRPLGEVLLFPRSSQRDGGRAEVGYVIGAAHRGRGLATRAVRLVVAYAHQRLGIEALQLRIGPGNLASERVAVACGFTRTDAALERLEQKGRPVELATWERTAEPE
jgi:RimJ/RimL family protein N-acetyltransferase